MNHHCSADWQSAVSQVANLLGVVTSEAVGEFHRSADWQSAKQQIGNLRYEGAPNQVA